MYDKVFQSLNEQVKKRNTPESFLPPENKRKDVIHRGYLRNSTFPIRYDFIPDGNAQNTGTHAYYFADGNNRGVVTVNHRISPKDSGHETESLISYEMISGKKPEDIDLHRIILPVVSHHSKSHDPDIINLHNSIKFSDDLTRRLGTNYISSTTKTNNTVLKKKLDPKISRVLTHIKNKLNNRKG